MPRLRTFLSFRRRSITVKLAAICGLLAASLVALMLVALRILPAEAHATREGVLLAQAQRANHHADMLHDALHVNLLRALLSGQLLGSSDQAMLQSLASNTAEFRRELAVPAETPLPAALHAHAERTRQAGLLYVELAERVARLALAERAAALQAMPEFDAAFETARLLLGEQTEWLARHALVLQAEARSEVERARYGLIVAAALAVLVGWAGVAAIGQSIRRSLRDLRDVAHRVADGELDQRSHFTGPDEVGQLGESVDRMATSLQAMIERMRAEAERSDYAGALARALDMSDREPETYRVVAQAMAEVSPQHAIELLISDSSDAHLECAAEHPTAGAPGCGVNTSFSCVAVRRGHAVSFPDSRALDACPRLRDRPAGPVAAACVPVTFMGRALGVLHASGPLNQPLDERMLDRLSTLGLQAGSRIGTVRAFERTQLQASTDALTGLPNRRSVEQRIRRLKQARTPFALALCDLDEFKRLNDSHGHPAGDDALRCFAEVARQTTRDADMAARWGGEEFVFVLADSDAHSAAKWTERLRLALAQALKERSTPSFTVSFGVVDGSAADSTDELVRLGDLALYRAKANGRNRTEIATSDGVADSPVRPRSEHASQVDVEMLVRAL